MSEKNVKFRKRIALLVAQPEENYHEAFIKGFLREAFANDFDVCIFSMYQRHQSTKIRARGESSIYSLMEYDMFDAVVLLASSIQTTRVLENLEEELHQKFKGPVIFVDEQSQYFCNIAPDNYQPIKQAISHLIEVHGYKDIAFLTGNEFHPHARMRLKGFLDCMEEHGLSVGENRVFYGDFWYNSGKGTAEQLLRDREHLPEAIACANDYMAIGLIEAFAKAGVRVPEDIAVTGYDDTPEGRNYSVPLTSVPIPTEACGEYSIRCVKALLNGEETEEFFASLPPKIGRSCGCCPQRDEAEILKKIMRPEDKFDFNVGTMEDDIIMQTELSNVLSIVLTYVWQIQPFEGFHLCLNRELADENFLKETESLSTYSEQILDAIQCERRSGADRISLSDVFPRKKLLPELWAPSEKPRAYFFTPVFFEENYFGYAAINYGEDLKSYDAAYKRWLGSLTHGLECFFRINMLNLRNEALEAAQTRDALTGLYNYTGVLKVAADSLLESKESELKLTAIELDGSKDIYTRYGRQVGDKLVLEFSQMLFIAYEEELIAYLGNGEFLVIEGMSEGKSEEILPALAGLGQKLAEYCSKNQIENPPVVYYAAHCAKADGEDAIATLVGEAVTKRNAQKVKAQRLQYNAVSEDESQMLELVADILDHNKLIYHFQPIVDVQSGEIFAYEALMRANVDQRISPLDILKYASLLGRLCDVEKATFLNVLHFMHEHEEDFGERKVFINSIPGTQIPENDFEVIKEQLKRYKGKIVVELTEQAEVDDSELEDLKKKYEKLGVDTAVDDYGTGYSNIYNLLRYMPNFVKIDRMLISEIQLSTQKQHFVKEIVKFCHDNNIAVLAEGVETADELKMVIFLGADLIQGYYTARPNAQVLDGIDHNVRSEIVQFGQYAMEKSQRKIFQAGNDGDISLIKIASAHFSKIRFTPEDMRHKDITLSGILGFSAGVEIDIADGYSGRIELKDVNLAVHNEQPAIRIGKGCNVVLVLTGENILEQGGILVPEDSTLTLQGEGNLSINHIAINGYGIGNDKDSRHGDIYFKQDGMISIYGNTLHGVGIGSGYGGNLYISRGGYSIQLSGEEAVGIGALYADVSMEISQCAINFDIKNTVSVGIGSVTGNVSLDFSHVGLSGRTSGSRGVCIGTVEGDDMRLTLADATIDYTARAENASGIGNLSGNADLQFRNFSMRIMAEGKNAFAMGNAGKTASIHTHNGDMNTNVKNTYDFDIGADTFEIINGNSEFIWNGTAVQREIIDGAL